MGKLDVVEIMVGTYFIAFTMLGFLGLWDFLFDLRMNEVSMIVGFLLAASSVLYGVVLGLGLVYSLRRLV